MRWRWWWQPPCLLRRVTVNFVHSEAEAIQGALWSVSGPWLTLKDVTALHAGQQPTPVPGDAVIHRDRISFLQVLP